MNRIFCHLLCPAYLNCILKPLIRAEGQLHFVTMAGKQLMKKCDLLASLAAILVSNMFGIPYSVGKGQVKDAALFDTFLKFYFSALSILNNESMKFNDFFEKFLLSSKTKIPQMLR